jgi:hypothetical protein
MRKEQLRLVGRNPRMVMGASEVHAADLSDKDQTIAAVAGSSVGRRLTAFLIAFWF